MSNHKITSAGLHKSELHKSIVAQPQYKTRQMLPPTNTHRGADLRALATVAARDYAEKLPVLIDLKQHFNSSAFLTDDGVGNRDL